MTWTEKRRVRITDGEVAVVDADAAARDRVAAEVPLGVAEGLAPLAVVVEAGRPGDDDSPR